MSSTGPTDRPRSSTIRTGYDPTEQRIEYLEDRYRDVRDDHRELEREVRRLKADLAFLKFQLFLALLLVVFLAVVIGAPLLTP